MADGLAKPLASSSAAHKPAVPCGPSSVTRSLEAIKRYEVQPEEIDDAILAAINVSLCLESEGDDHVAEGFNHDIVINGRAFARR
jgi:hypothetical protein